MFRRAVSKCVLGPPETPQICPASPTLDTNSLEFRDYVVSAHAVRNLAIESKLLSEVFRIQVRCYLARNPENWSLDYTSFGTPKIFRERERVKSHRLASLFNYYFRE